MNFNREKQKSIIEQELIERVCGLKTLYPSFVCTSEYTILSGGKRLRPLITLALFSDLNTEMDQIIQPALAIELIHTASLIHDDLPALDNDDYRRGKLSCHKRFTESEAILTGDFLPILGFNLIVNSDFNDQTKVKLTEFFSIAFMELCQGQAFDMQRAESFETISRLKTGALFKLCMRFGAIHQSDRLNEKKLNFELDRFGELMGLIFQTLDDIEDETDGSIGRLNQQLIKYQTELIELKEKLEIGLDREFVNLEEMLQYSKFIL